MTGLMVTHEYFDALGVQPARGRFFRADEDDEPGAETVVVLSWGLWQEQFAGSPSVLGQSIALNGRDFRVIGIAPDGFNGTMVTDRPRLFVPMAMQPHFMPESGLLLDRRGWGGVFLIGRLADGNSFRVAQEELETMGGVLAAEYPDTNEGRQYSVEPLSRSTLPPGFRAMIVPFSGLLMVVVGALLLTACFNVANLLLVRALRRRDEIQLRRSLGASRGRLIRQHLAQSFLLAVPAGVLGSLAASWGVGLFASLPLPNANYGLDGRVLFFSLGATIATGLFFGLLPAFRATSSGTRRARARRLALFGGRHSGRVGGPLVATQVAVSVVLLIAAALTLQTLVRLGRTDLGFSADNLLVARLDPGLHGRQASELGGFYDELRARLSPLRDVRSVTFASSLPGGGGDRSGIWVEGYTAPEGGIATRLAYTVVSVDYFATLEIPMFEGRSFMAADAADTAPVVVLNRGAARQLEELTGRPVVDQRISLSGPEGPFLAVVGVAADARLSSLRQEPRPAMFLAAKQAFAAGLSPALGLIVRSDGATTASLAGPVREIVRQVDPNLPVREIGTMSQRIFEDGLVQERLGVFSK